MRFGRQNTPYNRLHDNEERTLFVALILIVASIFFVGGGHPAAAQDFLKHASANPYSAHSYIAHTQPLPVSGSIVAIYSTDSNPFNALVGKRRVRNREPQRVDKRVQRYVVANGNREFLFQGTEGQIRIQFLCGKNDQRIACQIDSEREAAEIHTLVATRAPRGDIIYKDVNGNTLLRIASYGGATVWWPGETEALAASRSFSDRITLALPLVNERTVLRRATRATAILSAITGAPIEFDTGIYGYSATVEDPEVSEPVAFAASSKLGDTSSFISRGFAQDNFSDLEAVPEIDSENEIETGVAVSAEPVQPLSPKSAVLADTIVMTSKGMASVASDPTGARVIGTRLKSVRFLEADAPSMLLENQHFEVRYSPALGLKGRPTSAEVERFLEENL